MDVTMGTDGIQDNMVDYIRKIEYSKLTGPDEKMLESANFKEYRRLVMQMRWPAAHVMPDFLYRISALAQKFKGPSYADVKKANTTLKDMKALAESGGAILKYPNIGGEVMFVTYFDASLGKEEKGQSQQGAVHFITSVKAETQPAPAGILEFNSSRISRVVRSSMAAEAASMTMAADHQLYNRLLWEALTKGQLEVHGDWRQRLTTRGLVVTDAKSLYDHVKKVGHLTAERQTALDLHLTKQMVEKGILGICWCPTFKQYADALTKEMDTEQFTVYRHFSRGASRAAPKGTARKAQAPHECRLVNSNTLFPLCELLAAWHAVDKPQLCTDLSMQERLLPALRLSPPNRGNFCSGGWFFWGRSHSCKQRMRETDDPLACSFFTSTYC